MLMPGVPLTTEAMNEIYKKLAGAQKVSRSLAPENLLCCEAGRLIWWTPSARRLIFFDTGNKKFDNEVGGKEVLHPALLFVAEERTLFVFALKSNARPNGKTPLFAAPYFNLYERGAMCAGSGRVPTGCNAKDIPAWEKLFFETNFSHTNRDARKLCRHPGGHDGLWREMARTRNAPKTFPAKYLTPDKRKVEDLLNGRL
jgi:PRTRC genetic system protein B